MATINELIAVLTKLEKQYGDLTCIVEVQPGLLEALDADFKVRYTSAEDLESDDGTVSKRKSDLRNIKILHLDLTNGGHWR